jgi:hypothetical protein
MLDDDRIVTELATCQAQIADVVADFESIIAPLRERERELDAEIKVRIVEAGGTAMPHPEYVVSLEQRTELSKRINVLKRLIGLVPDEELGKALYEYAPPPEWKADARYLQPLAKRYGGRVREIIDEGLVRVAVGPPKLKIIPREKRVTPLSVTEKP